MVARWIRDLKYGNQPHLAAPLGSLLAWPASSLLGPPAGSRRARWKALIVPVPMHPARLLQRGYNQASLLANALGHALSLPVLSDLLARVDDGPPQAGLDRGERLRLLGSAFTVVRLAGLPVTDVLLVDDVLTTGATLEACAMQLVEAGARRVFGCVIAAGVQRRLWG
jgi:ComF family protein